MEDYDRIVLGAGIIGACAAYQLVKAGHRRVLLVDQFPLPHSRGSSHGQSRIIRTAYQDLVQAQMAQRSRTLWSDIEHQIGETLCHDFPMLIVARSRSDPMFEAYVSCLEERTVLETGQLSRLLPAASFPAGSVGCVDRTAGVLRADRCVLAVTDLFTAAGGHVRHRWRVTRVEADAATVRLEGPAGRLTGRRLVICAGAWAAPLLATLGLQLQGVLRPLRTAVTYWRLRPGYSVAMSGIDLGEAGRAVYYYWLPCFEYPGMIKLSAHAGNSCDPDSRDQTSVDDIILHCSEYVAKHFPGLEEKPAIVETCMYTDTPDMRCVLDRHPIHSNIVFAAGMSGQGFKMGPVFGEILQQLIDGEKCQFDLSMFSMHRFSASAERNRSAL